MPTLLADAELAGFVSTKAADEYCRNNFKRGANLKRCGESLLPAHHPPRAVPELEDSPFSLCAGSIGNNKLPEPLKNYWNYETKQERDDRMSGTN